MNGPVTADIDAFVELLVAGDARPEGLRPERAEHPGEEPIQRRLQPTRTGASWATCPSTTAAARSGRTSSTIPTTAPPKAYTLVNGGFGVRWSKNKVTTSLKVVNLANQDVQQHVFGDILKRQVVGEMRVRF